MNKHKTSWWAKSSYERFIESAKRSHQETTRQKRRVGSKDQWKRLRKSSDNIRAPTATAIRDDAGAVRQQKKVKHKTSWWAKKSYEQAMTAKAEKRKTHWWAKRGYEHFIVSAKRNPERQMTKWASKRQSESKNNAMML